MTRYMPLCGCFALALLSGCSETEPNPKTPNTAGSGDATIAASDPQPTDADPDNDDAVGDPAITTVWDPAVDGPFAYAERDAEMVLPSGNDTVALHLAYPTGTAQYPVILFGHGFQLPISQYHSYLRRLASFGYVAVAVDFPDSLSGNDNPAQAGALVAAIDWLKHDVSLGAHVDDSRVGVSGHSLGGKLAILAATLDQRIVAAFALDPVDNGGSSSCEPPSCVEVKNLMPSLAIPTGFVGETTDASAWLQACAPADDNYTTFYTRANAPSLEITAVGANHMSFLDDLGSCGYLCALCNDSNVDNEQVVGMAQAMMIAFYERYLRGTVGYEPYLTGTIAHERYVATGQATLRQK